MFNTIFQVLEIIALVVFAPVIFFFALHFALIGFAVCDFSPSLFIETCKGYGASRFTGKFATTKI